MRIAALAVLLLIASCGSRQPQGAEEPPVSAPAVDQLAEIRELVTAYTDAFEAVSIDRVGPLYSQDLDLVLVYQGREHRGWTAVQSFWAGRLEGATTVRMSIKDVSIRELGPGRAVLSARRATSTGDGSVTVTEDGGLTLVLEKRDHRWMVVTEHFSYPIGRS